MTQLVHHGPLFNAGAPQCTNDARYILKLHFLGGLGEELDKIAISLHSHLPLETLKFLSLTKPISIWSSFVYSQ